MRRTSYQKGSLKLADRKNGKAWEYRWREVQIDGSIRRKNVVIGTLEDYPNESVAQAAVDAIRLQVNQQTPQQLIKSINLETLVNHYRQHELPDVFNNMKPQPGARDEETKSYATQVTYEGYLKKWILPVGVRAGSKTSKQPLSKTGSKSCAFPKPIFHWHAEARPKSAIS